MLQLQNNSPFSAKLSVMPNAQGVDTLFVITRATFNVGPQLTLADDQSPPNEADEYHGEPAESSLKWPSDYHLGKRCTDIIVLGSAIAKDGVAVRALDVTVQVGDYHKSVRVFGERYWQNGVMSQPEPFVTMPIVYERAYGGLERSENNEGAVVDAETRNPVGVGFLGKRSATALNGSALPNIENPNDLIQSAKDTPAPTGFAPIAPNWHPRVAYAGTYDDQWQQTRAPYLPTDFDSRFFNCATPEFICDGYLQGGELCRITNMHADGLLEFSLPRLNLRCSASVAGQTRVLQSDLETVMLQPNARSMTLVWRASLVCDKQIQQVDKVVLSVT